MSPPYKEKLTYLKRVKNVYSRNNSQPIVSYFFFENIKVWKTYILEESTQKNTLNIKNIELPLLI